MSTTSFHIDKAERNEQFYSSHNLRVSPYNEWAVVVLFYVAVHYVDAVLAQDGQLDARLRHPRNHPDRNVGVAKSGTLMPIAIRYMNLYDRSRDARYNRISFPAHFLRNLEAQSFAPVRGHVRTALGLSP